MHLQHVCTSWMKLLCCSCKPLVLINRNDFSVRSHSSSMPQPTLKININDAKLTMPTFQLKVFETALNCNDSSETTAKKQPIESKKKIASAPALKIRPERRCKRACLSRGTNTVSFSWGPFLAGKRHGTFIKHRNLQHFGAQTVCTSFWCYNFAAKVCHKQMWNLGAV